MSDDGRVLVSVDGAVGTLTLNRPEKLNSFAGTMRDEIAGGLEELAADERERAVIVTGRGRAFCTGADVRYLAELLEGNGVVAARARGGGGRRVVTTIA